MTQPGLKPATWDLQDGGTDHWVTTAFDLNASTSTIKATYVCVLQADAHRVDFIWLLQKENDSVSPTKLLCYIGQS